MPSQERLVSIFLEGLLNRELHASLYMKHHKNLNQCINDAIDFDDNCGAMDKKNEAKSYGASSSNGSVASQVEEITKGVMEKIQHLYDPPRTSEPRRVERPYICGNCGGNHPTSQCLPRAPGVPRQELRPSLWCDFDKNGESTLRRKVIIELGS